MPKRTTRKPGHREGHFAQRSGWLRAAVLGADDGLVSVSSILVGVASGGARVSIMLAAGIAGLVAGAMSMAAGEYVSVSTQRDVEIADRLREQEELQQNPDAEFQELVSLYEARGLSRDLATQVAEALHAKDALSAHLQDEIGQQPAAAAHPWQAALASALSFLVGGIFPIFGVLAMTADRTISIVAITLVGLLVSGVFSGRLSGTPILRPMTRLLLGGGAAMLITAIVGNVVHRFIP